MNPESREKDAQSAALRYSGEFGLPTLLLGIAATAGYCIVLALATFGVTSTLISIAILSLFVYILYTPMHESAHRNICGKFTRLAWVDGTVGVVVSVVMGVSYSMYRAAHMAHHRKTNCAGEDPDMVFGNGRWYEVLSGSLRSVQSEYQWYFQHAWVGAPTRQKARFTAEVSAIVVSRVGIALLGYPEAAVLFGILPNIIGSMLVATTFAWLVHRPYDRTDRYGNTGTYVFDGWIGTPITAIWLCQNYHSIHHLFPRVPFYRYRKLFAEAEGVMIANGATIHRFG